MNKKDKDFLKHLLLTFREEAEDHLKAITSGLLDLEKIPSFEDQVKILEKIYRETHSLKGAARAVNLTHIETVCQSLEGVFLSLKREELSLSPELFDTLHSVVDTISKLTTSTYEEQEALTPEIINQLNLLITGKQEKRIQLKREKDVAIPPEAIAPVERPEVPETVRIAVSKLESLLLQAEEFLSPKLVADQQVTDLRDVITMIHHWKRERAKIFTDIGAGVGKKDGGKEKRLLEFLHWSEIHIKKLEERLKRMSFSARNESYSLTSMVDNLIEDMRKVVMLPFSTVLEAFPKMVRDLSREKGKEVDLFIHGGEIEIDKRILEEMKAPLTHLVRNSIDHGIEKPEERLKKGKDGRGKINISISRTNTNKVEILISDDGAGMDIESIKDAAVRNGIISEDESKRLNEQEALSLLFRSGVSTSQIITDISGRGLGLAIVREKVENLSGSISIETVPDKGASFRIVLPLTLATFRGVLVRSSGHIFVIPLTNVERVMRINKEDIKTVENRETIPLNGHVLSIVRLNDVLGLKHRENGKERNGNGTVTAVILTAAERHIAFFVDEVMNEQEVPVKALGKQLSRIKNISGVTVLGTGRVVPILNVLDLIKSAMKVTARPVTAPPIEEKVVERKNILVVEDSITSRMLLKNIIESAGYNVRTAVDGIDAYTALKTEDFDLVVSDIEMPGMDGFELTSKIRGDKRLEEMPVVLVTALESREDRERGIDVGANAYIIKSSFDQSNLLEVIRKLI